MTYSKSDETILRHVGIDIAWIVRVGKSDIDPSLGNDMAGDSRKACGDVQCFGVRAVHVCLRMGTLAHYVCSAA